jgi:hypothetical protein
MALDMPYTSPAITLLSKAGIAMQAASLKRFEYFI